MTRWRFYRSSSFLRISRKRGVVGSHNAATHHVGKAGRGGRDTTGALKARDWWSRGVSSPGELWIGEIGMSKSF